MSRTVAHRVTTGTRSEHEALVRVGLLHDVGFAFAAAFLATTYLVYEPDNTFSTVKEVMFKPVDDSRISLKGASSRMVAQ